MERMLRYLRFLLIVDYQIPWFLPVFGTVLLAVASNLLYDITKTTLGTWGTLLTLAGMLALGVVLVMLALRRSTPPPGFDVKDRPRPHQYEGLIALVSSRPVVEKAIAYHCPVLKCCWFIVTPETLTMAAEIQGQYLDKGIRCHVREIKDEYDTEGCLTAVRHIFTVEVLDEGLTAKRVIADITGGTKPMTAGMLIACMSGEYAVQHTPSRYRYDSEKGRRVPDGLLDPIEIDILPRSLRQEETKTDAR